MRTSPWPSTSECGDGLCGPMKIFRELLHKSLDQCNSASSAYLAWRKRLGRNLANSSGGIDFAHGTLAGKANPETDLETDLNLTSLDRVELMGSAGRSLPGNL